MINIAAIQSLRGVASSMVVIFHIILFTQPFGLGRIDALKSGVDIFFVISGFIMWVTTAAKSKVTAFQFYRDRIIRIVPLYWFLTVLTVLLVSATPLHIFSSFLFLPYANTAGFSPVLLPGWTLMYEMFFYLLFGAAILISPSRLTRRAVLILSALILLVIIGRLKKLHGISAFYTDAIVAEFAFGIILGILFRFRQTPAHSLWTLAAIFGFALIGLSLITYTGPRVIALGIPATLIVAGAVFGSWPRLKLFETVGDWSYSLYLSHWIVLLVAIPYIPDVPTPGWIKALILLVVSLFTSAFCYLFFEEPVTRRLKAVQMGQRSVKIRY